MSKSTYRADVFTYLSAYSSLCVSLSLSPTQIITFFGGQVYTNEVTSGTSRLSFAGDYLKGDASLLLSDLQLTDSGEYYCKVKMGGKYHWSQVNLIVLGESALQLCLSHTLINRELARAHFLSHAD